MYLYFCRFKLMFQGSIILPVDSEDYTSSYEVWMLCSELLGDVSVDLQRPRSVMSTAIQFIRLNIKSFYNIESFQDNIK